MLSDLIIGYLFFGGAGAGCAVACSTFALMADAPSLSRSLSRRFQGSGDRPWTQLFAYGYLCALASILLGVVCLLADVGQPERLLMLFFPPKASYLAVGAWCIALCAVLSAVLFFVWHGVISISMTLLRGLSVTCILIGMGVTVYTGLLLSNVAAVPVWNTVWLVLVFCFSALSCGVALLVITALLSGAMQRFSQASSFLMKADCLLIVAEVFVLALYIGGLYLAWGDTSDIPNASIIAGIESMDSLLHGDLSFGFWGGVVIVGFIVPLVSEALLIQRGGSGYPPISLIGRQWFVVVSSASVLVGGALLRYLIVHAGAHPALLMAM